jgi:hypothetical protein
VGSADVGAVITGFSRKAPTTALEPIGLNGAHIWIFVFRIAWDAIRLHC